MLTSRSQTGAAGRWWLLAWLLVSVVAWSRPNPIVLSPAAGTSAVGDALEFLLDPSSGFNIDYVRELPDTAWQAVGHDRPNFGFTDHAVWLRLAFDHPHLEADTYFIEMGLPYLDHVEFFRVDADSGTVEQHIVTGKLKPFHSRPYPRPDFVFPLAMKPHERTLVYFKLESQGTVIAPVQVYTRQGIAQIETLTDTFFGLVVGAMLVTLLYNGFLWARLRETIFGYFAAMTLAALVLTLQLQGFGYRFLWPEATLFNSHLLLWSAQMAAVFFLLFTRRFLELAASRPGLYQTGGVLVALILLLMMAQPFIPYRIASQTTQILGLLVAAYSVLVAVVQVVSGSARANQYILAMIALVLGCVLQVLRNFGVLPHTPVTEYAATLGVLLTVMLLSFSHASLLREETIGKQQAQRFAQSNLRRFKSLFQHSMEGIFVADHQGNMLEANPAFRRIFGFPDKGNAVLERHASSFYARGQDYRDTMRRLMQRGAVETEVELVKQNGDVLLASLKMRLNEPHVPTYSTVEGELVDITRQRADQLELEHIARHDTLTQLWNRYEFENCLGNAVTEVQAGEADYCLLYIDLDDFKVVNDTNGHGAGDAMLRELAERMLDGLNGRGVLARIGGDEFGTIVPTTQAEAHAIAAELLDAIREYRFTWNDRVFKVSASIGLVELRASDTIALTKELALSLADTACYAAKEQGRNRIQVYSEHNAELRQHRDQMRWIAALNQALSQDRFELYQQPIRPLGTTHEGERYEILLRMIDEDGDLVSPGAFIPAAERFHLMAQIDRWVIEHYFSWLQQNPLHMGRLRHASINLSAQSLEDEGMQAFIESCLNRYGIHADTICFEITESSAVTHLGRTVQLLEALRSRGCRFALDDFGSGFSSYAYLRSLPVDYLKIDGAFVRRLHLDAIDAAMVRSINEVGKAMGMQTIAEFVENQAIMDHLHEMGIDYAQGYHLSPPQPLQALCDSPYQQGTG